MEGHIKAASDLCHQSGDTAAFLIYPSVVPTLSFEANLKTRRRIEDRLLSAGLEIDNELLVTCSIQERHGNDRRRLGLVCRLCVSGRVGTDSPWLKSDASMTGKLEGVPLMRMRDVSPLIFPGSVGCSDNHNFSANERASLKGAAACAKIVETLAQGLNINPATTKLVLLDMNTFLFADWLQGAWQMQQEWAASETTKPLVTCISFCQDNSYYQAIRGHMEQKLLDTWWFNQPQAGPSEPSQSPDLIVDKPVLRLATWTGSTPALPAFILNKFQEEDAHHTQWATLCQAFKTTIDKKAAAMSGGTDPTLPDGLKLRSPDWSVPPTVPDLAAAVSPIADLAASDFPTDTVCHVGSKQF
jgi:hypothetical protein